MSQIHKDSTSFPEVSKVQSINFFDKFPDDARIVDVHKQLIEIWAKVKAEMRKEDYKNYNNLLHNKYINFRFYMNGSRNPPVNFIRDINKIAQELNMNFNLAALFSKSKIKFGHGGNAATAELPITLTPKLAYLIGAMRDGTIARFGKYEISYSQKNIEWLKLIQKLLIEIFNPSNHPEIRNNRVTLSNRPIFEYYHRVFEIPIGKKDEWETPEIIKKASNSIKRSYIRGFYDADGLSEEFGFCQVNKEAILFVYNTLNELGIKTGSFRVRKVLGKKDLYLFNTSRKSHIDFIKLIGSMNPSKQKRFLTLNKTL